MTKTYIKVGDQTVEAGSVTNNQSRAFRDAWALEGDVITVDMVKARDITRDRLRAERAPLLDALDTEFMKALETGGDTVAITAEKNRLRDITSLPSIDAALTPEALEIISVNA